MELAQRFYTRLNQSTLGQNREDIERVINIIKGSYVSANVGSYLPTTFNPNEYIYRDTLNKLTELLTRIKQAQNTSEILNNILEFIQHRSFTPGGASSELICCLLADSAIEKTEITNLLAETHSDFVAQLRELILTSKVSSEVDRLTAERDATETTAMTVASIQSMPVTGGVVLPDGIQNSTVPLAFRFGRADPDAASGFSHAPTEQSAPIPINGAPDKQERRRGLEAGDVLSTRFGDFDDHNDGGKNAGGSFSLPAAVGSLIGGVVGLWGFPDSDADETPGGDLSAYERRRRFVLE